jgi:hypothetical protein
MVRSMDCYPDLLGFHNCIPLEYALWARSYLVKVHTVAPELITLTTELNASIANIHSTTSTIFLGVQALARCLKVVVVTGDDNTTLEIHNFCSKFEIMSLDLPKAAPVIMKSWCIKVNHVSINFLDAVHG